jgi:hypothetical protein
MSTIEQDLRILAEVQAEMKRQIDLWGVQSHPSGTGYAGSGDALAFARDNFEKCTKNNMLTWHEILEEEVHEAYAETDLSKLRTELIQVAAVALSWVRDIDGR